MASSLRATVALCSCCLLLLALPITLGHYAAPSVADISIHSVDTGHSSVTLADRRKANSSPLAECTFTYATDELGAQAKAMKPMAAPVDDRPPTDKVDVREVSRALEGGCITSTSDYWTYEYCFGRYFKQYHGGDVYWLAKQSAPDALALESDDRSFIVGGGDMCTVLTPPAPRKVKVNWSCRKASTTPQIISIKEVTTCFYHIQIASSHVCRDPTFPIIPDDWVAPSTPVVMDTGSEDWYLELTELETGDESAEPLLMCQAYSLEYRATSVKALRFSQYELKITRLQGNPKSHRSTIAELLPPYRSPVARSPSRVPVPAEHLQATYGSVVLAPNVNGKTQYDGQLSLLKVFA